MNSTSVSQKCCCTCQHFGGNSQRQGSSVKWEGSTHVCKIKSRGNGNQGCMNGACSKWEEKK